MEHMKQKRTRYLGLGLVILGIMAVLGLWNLVPVVLLGAVGAYIYMERRREGRIGAAVQSALWLVGVALLLAVHFVVPGILLLAGASLLLRGREQQVDQRLSALLARFGIDLDAKAKVAIPAQTAQPEQKPADTTPAAPSTGETTRL